MITWADDSVALGTCLSKADDQDPLLDQRADDLHAEPGRRPAAEEYAEDHIAPEIDARLVAVWRVLTPKGVPLGGRSSGHLPRIVHIALVAFFQHAQRRHSLERQHHQHPRQRPHRVGAVTVKRTSRLAAVWSPSRDRASTLSTYRPGGRSVSGIRAVYP